MGSPPVNQIRPPLPSKDILPLHGLRFFAAFWVVIFHNFYLSGIKLDYSHWVWKFIASGHLAVSLFFLLSGFILQHVYQQPIENRSAHQAFWRARLARIYPLFILGLLLDAPRSINYFLQTNTWEIGIVKFIVVVISNIFLIQAWFPWLSPALNSPGWSLSNEAFFYFLFPRLSRALNKMAREHMVTAFWILWLFQILLNLIVELILQPTRGSALLTFLQLSPLMHLLEFVLGIILALHFRTRSELNYSLPAWPLLIAPLAFVSMIFLHLKIPHLVYHNGLFLPLFAWLILWLSSAKNMVTKFLSTPVMILLGQSSYALYILHQPIKNYTSLLGLEDSILSFTVYIATAIGISIICYKYLEEPARKWINPRK